MSVQSISETVAYIKEKSGLEISAPEVSRYRNSWKQESYQWFMTLAKSKHAFFAEYRLRIESVIDCIKRNVQLFDETRDINTKRKILADIVHMNESILQMYKALPFSYVNEELDEMVVTEMKILNEKRKTKQNDLRSQQYSHSHDEITGRPYDDGEWVVKPDNVSRPYVYYSDRYHEKDRLGFLTEEDKRRVKETMKSSHERLFPDQKYEDEEIKKEREREKQRQEYEKYQREYAEYERKREKEARGEID